MDLLLSWFSAQILISILLAGIGFALALYTIKNKAWKISLAVIIGLLLIASFSASYFDHKEQDRKIKAQDKKFDDLTNEVRADLANKNLSTQEITDKLKLAYQNYFDASPQEAKEWSDTFLPKVPEKLAQHNEMSSQEQELAQKLELRWKPLYDYILVCFDDRIKELNEGVQKRNNKNQIKHDEKIDLKNLILIRDNRPQGFNVRNEVFPNGTHLIVTVQQGTIHSGVLYAELDIEFKENYSPFNLLRVLFDKDSIRLLVNNKKEQVAKKDPLLDQDFRNHIVDAINNAIEQVYLDDAQK